MPNPVTFQLISKIKDPDLHEFVFAWDELEALIIAVFREKSADHDAESVYQVLRSQLQAQYLIWKDVLESYWKSSRIKGQFQITDPFLRILSVERARNFIRDWEAMKHLPAAREALNNYLLFRISSEKN